MKILLVILSIIMLIQPIIILNACSETSTKEPVHGLCAGHTELHCVELSVTAMMAEAEPPIMDFNNDERIVSFASSEAEATRNMTDGGLIDIKDDYVLSGSITPPSDQYLRKEQTEHLYWIKSNGRVHQVPAETESRFEEASGESDNVNPINVSISLAHSPSINVSISLAHSPSINEITELSMEVICL